MSVVPYHQLYFTLLHSTLLCSALLRTTLLCCTLFYTTVLYCDVLYFPLFIRPLGAVHFDAAILMAEHSIKQKCMLAGDNIIKSDNLGGQILQYDGMCGLY
jgi:hypothetical protein